MLKKILLLIIIGYQRLISPIFSPNCRFYPSCSQYAYESIQTHGIWKGLFYALIRLLKCHPFNNGGYDPIKE